MCSSFFLCSNRLEDSLVVANKLGHALCDFDLVIYLASCELALEECPQSCSALEHRIKECQCCIHVGFRVTYLGM